MSALLICNLASIASVLIAGIGAFYHIDGWGWFLFVALLLAESSNSRRGSRT